MNCYRHPDTRAAGMCSEGCGRGLCSGCISRYGRPICEHCYIELATEYQTALAADRSLITRRLTINGIVLGCLILGMVIMQLSVAVSTTPNPVFALTGSFLALPTLIWALINFNILMDKLAEKTGMVFFTTLHNWCLIFLIGSVVVAPLAIIILPINIISDIQRLRELS